MGASFLFCRIWGSNVNIFCQTELWKIEFIEPGLANHEYLQKSAGKFGFFSKLSKIYMPLAVYPGTDTERNSLPQGTLLQWKDKCIEMFETKLRNEHYLLEYNDLRKK